MEQDYLRPAGAAKRAGVSVGTIRRWLDDPAVKLTKHVDGTRRVWVNVYELDALTAPRPVTGVGA